LANDGGPKTTTKKRRAVSLVERSGLAVEEVRGNVATTRVADVEAADFLFELSTTPVAVDVRHRIGLPMHQSTVRLAERQRRHSPDDARTRP